MHTENNAQTLIKVNTMKTYAHRKQQTLIQGNTMEKNYAYIQDYSNTQNTHTSRRNEELTTTQTTALKHSKHSYKSIQRRNVHIHTTSLTHSYK